MRGVIRNASVMRGLELRAIPISAVAIRTALKRPLRGVDSAAAPPKFIVFNSAALDPEVSKLSLNSDKIYFHNYAVITLRSPQSRIPDSKIEYYEVDSANNGPSILMHGETIP
jgi:hypothetical protein